MTDFKVGDIVVLTAGSMRMGVEGVDGDTVSTIWCHEGQIGRDSFPAVLLKKWEFREDNSHGKPYKGDRDNRRNDDRGGDRGGRDRDDRPRGKPGWDGKPREKKFFRKD
ncbi:MAG: hypothetical protein AAFQ51_16545 [Pseudomonadota bacterium]